MKEIVVVKQACESRPFTTPTLWYYSRMVQVQKAQGVLEKHHSILGGPWSQVWTQPSF